jgi:uroporphyrinogen-III decarboxylase
MFQPFTNISENVHIPQLMPLAMPQVQDMLQKLMDAGKAFQETGQVIKKYAGMGVTYGFPVMGMVFCKAPFDILGDTLRGTRNIMMDMFRRPEKLLHALDVIADNMIHTILKTPNIHKMCGVSYPLHKGADGWMSQEQFDTFYWPSLKKMMDAFIQEGLIQRMFAEGSYNTRLKRVNEFPKGTVTWYFDQTDMAKAKEILGDQCCIQGNVPTSLILTGKPEEVKEHCRKLIETCGKGGGYILSTGAMAGGVSLENIRAMLAAVKEYGTYKR